MLFRSLALSAVVQSHSVYVLFKIALADKSCQRILLDVVSIKDDVLVIESSSDRTKLKIYRWAIRGKEAPATETVEAPKEAKKDAK